MTLLLESGAERDADILEGIFTAVSYIFKYLSKQLSADLPGVLRHTSGFRSVATVYGIKAQGAKRHKSKEVVSVCGVCWGVPIYLYNCPSS